MLAAEVVALRAEMARMRAAAAEPVADAAASFAAARLAREAAAESMRLRCEVERLRSVNQALIECPLCMEVERPRDTALPCGHAYCAACVAGLVVRQCPECRKEFGHTTRLFL